MARPIILLDWDGTLAAHGEESLLPGARPVIDELLARGHRLVLFSNNCTADEFAAATGILHLFAYVAIGCPNDDDLKEWNWQRTRAALNCDASDTVLFDDYAGNVVAHQERGGWAHRVNVIQGITLVDLRAALDGEKLTSAR